MTPTTTLTPSETITTPCDSCGEPATHQLERAFNPQFGDRERRCEICARRDSNHTRGEAWAAVTLLGYAAHVARDAGMTDAEIIAALTAALSGSPVAWATYGPDAALPDWMRGGFEQDRRWAPLDGNGEA